ncbi:hypothetical protein QR680_012761 [Steinernema hermaphroditum]|uniref:Uncharacterized protein n=1 Tax=Steinernema hermaphroditum TaxID=289476 RepID=A0AA39M0C8_9BILA|nr:hypothetical protein QR680_012761 [Steinernema hermaphroditum]
MSSRHLVLGRPSGLETIGLQSRRCVKSRFVSCDSRGDFSSVSRANSAAAWTCATR